MSDLYDILDPWGPAASGSASAGPAPPLLAGSAGPEELARQSLVVLPPVYAAAYAEALAAGGGRITRDTLQSTLARARLPRHITGQIVLAADAGNDALTQRDFNLALAMAALAQKNMSPTLEGIMFHKDALPLLELDGVEAPAASDDPWLSAAANGGAAGPDAAAAAATAGLGSLALGPDSAAKERPLSPGRGALGTAGAVAATVPNISLDAAQWRLDLEDVSIKEAAEKGGIVFKHTNYEVTTRSFSSMVVRRYNDFSWMSDYLVKRYPYRMHANIPPKGFPVVDRRFLDNRIKGLTRFACAILRTPFLQRDAIVIQFFTNTDEFTHVLRVGNLDTDVEEIDVDSEVGATPWAEVQQTYDALADFYRQVAQDEDKYRAQIQALEKIARYERAIGDELCAYSDTMRVANAPRESVSGSRKFHAVPAAKRALDGALNELSMSLSDVSLLGKSHGEVLKSVSAEHLRRLYDAVVSMKLMMDRMRLMDKRKPIERARERIDALRKQLAQVAADAPAAADRASTERLERQVADESAELDLLEREQRRIELRFHQELARYRCYECFLHRHYRAFVEAHIKHHTLALDAWRQALATAAELPAEPRGFIL
ncbi:Sorting nexin mvp1 [Coemansia helicoidea]|uniref:Sorting nexin mvp1 n=1 Tax=Coemansia helicoidea TaxID=1286919 RepID=A0ACC1L6B0_9FUNG|nr:Sorting nexin mvp1 [Coemansia helicoidea]